MLFVFVPLAFGLSFAFGLTRTRVGLRGVAPNPYVARRPEFSRTLCKMLLLVHSMGETSSKLLSLQLILILK